MTCYNEEEALQILHKEAGLKKNGIDEEDGKQNWRGTDEQWSKLIDLLNKRDGYVQDIYNKKS